MKNNCFYDHEQKVGGGVLQFVIHNGAAENEREAAQYLRDCGLIADLTGPDSETPTELRHHTYVDERGGWLRKVTKFTNRDWRQYRWEDAQWKPKVAGVRNVPYGLDQLRRNNEDGLCFVFEGEKDVERACHNGVIATCNVGSAGKWTIDLKQYLVGRTVCIVLDNDDAGSKHATTVQTSLRSSGIDCFILWDYRHGLNEKGDFSNWMDVNCNDFSKFQSLAESAAEAPRQVKTPPEGEAITSGPLSSKKPTEDELADIVLQALGEQKPNYNFFWHNALEWPTLALSG